MITQFRLTGAFVAALIAATTLLEPAQAQTHIGYGVNGNGILFRFDLDNPNAAVTNIGNVGFVPEGIDFRPGSSSLYAIDVNLRTFTLYTVNISTAATTPVGSFISIGTVGGVAYDLSDATSYGFDFNPTTLAGDGSMRIRFVSNLGTNLRLNSSTGAIAAVDTSLSYPAGDVNFDHSPAVDGLAYINGNAATNGGQTVLFAMDFGRDTLAEITPANSGLMSTHGAYGVTIDSLQNVGFDILTDANSSDSSINGDHGYAVFRRPVGTTGLPGDWLLYNVNLTTGAMTGGALVGIAGGNSPADFTGDLAVLAVPEPCTAALAVAALAACWLRPRRVV